VRIMDKIIYFDNAATTFPKPEVVYDTLDRVTRTLSVNSGRGGYRLASQAGMIIDETRRFLAELVNISDDRKVIFMPSATIALNTVLNGINWLAGDNVYFSPFEHNSTLRPLEVLKNKFHLNLIEMPFNKINCEAELNKLEQMLKRFRPKLAILSHASNVCGIITPVAEVTQLVHKYGGQILVDGAQTLGLVPIDLTKTKCDYYVFAGHKNLYGVFGVGGIIVNNDYLLEPSIVGGTGTNSEELVMPYDYPGRLEAGSPNINAIAGLNAGIKWLKEQQGLLDKERRLLGEFFSLVSDYPEIKVVGIEAVDKMVPVVSCVFEGYTPQEIALTLDQNFNIAVRAGLQCAPLAHRFLGTMPLGTVRFSFGIHNNKRDLELLDEALKEIYY
jgi:cysteine desulfurase family protein